MLPTGPTFATFFWHQSRFFIAQGALQEAIDALETPEQMLTSLEGSHVQSSAQGLHYAYAAAPSEVPGSGLDSFLPGVDSKSFAVRPRCVSG